MKVLPLSWAQRVRGAIPNRVERELRRSLAERFVLISLTAVIAGPCVAQTATPASPAVEDSARLVDIVVTARRVSERLQEIPASVSAVTGDQVANMNSLSDIQSLVSGVTFKTFGPIPTVGIRGYGNRTQAGIALNSTVGIFQDGVFVSPPLATLISSVDTDRIEVAKGPQSTLYGRSSFTGAINVVSNDPAKQLSGYLDTGYGSSSVPGDNLWHIRGALSVPLSDTLSVRFFALRENRDGYTYDSVTGNRGGGEDRSIGRVRILWEPNDVFTARVTGTVIRDDLPMALVHSGLSPAPLGQQVIFGDPFNPKVQSALQFGHTVWDAQYVLPPSAKTRGEQGTIDLRFQTPLGELASLTDYQHSYQDIHISVDLTRLSLANGDTPFDENRWSQEFRLSNKIGSVSYLAGVYYLQTIDRQSGGEAVDLSHPFARFNPGSALFDLAHFEALYQPTYTKTDAYAAFAQLGYDFTEKLNLTAGVRQSRDEISGSTGTSFETVTNFLIPTTPITYREAAFNATTGSANLSYKLLPDVMVYGSYSRGNSPGGLNGGGAALVDYAPQTVNAFEIGLKSELFDRHLQLNAALFDNQYSDLQLTQNTFIKGALTPLITNAGKAQGRGIDLDAIEILSSNWRLGLQYTYVDSKITQYSVPPPPAPQVNFTGVPLVRSPRNSVNGSVTFSENIGPGMFKITAEESYTSSYTNDYQGVPAGTAYPGIPGVLPPGVTTSQVLALYRTKGYALTNMDASYGWNNWQLSAYVRNLLNHQYIAAVLGFDTVSYPQEIAGEPRTYEVSLKYSF